MNVCLRNSLFEPSTVRALYTHPAERISTNKLDRPIIAQRPATPGKGRGMHPDTRQQLLSMLPTHGEGDAPDERSEGLHGSSSTRQTALRHDKLKGWSSTKGTRRGGGKTPFQAALPAQRSTPSAPALYPCHLLATHSRTSAPRPGYPPVELVPTLQTKGGPSLGLCASTSPVACLRAAYLVTRSAGGCAYAFSPREALFIYMSGSAPSSDLISIGTRFTLFILRRPAQRGVDEAIGILENRSAVPDIECQLTGDASLHSGPLPVIDIVRY
ncbi:hypothetical protein C8R45DRAFT_1212835 [Mycena sanguinolenta]|nr:hypothetical protein C8R45DRAFT_1212835 [Mycena sanguinolenta]